MRSANKNTDADLFLAFEDETLRSCRSDKADHDGIVNEFGSLKWLDC